MKKQLLTAACALFLTVGAANAQIVVRIGPPPPRPVEVIPAPRPCTTTGSGFRAIIAGMATATSGSPAATAARLIAAPFGLRASGVRSAAATSGTPATGNGR